MKKLSTISFFCMCAIGLLSLSCEPSSHQPDVTHLSWTIESDTISALVSDTAMVSFGSISHVLTTDKEELILFDKLNQRVLVTDSAGLLLHSLRNFGRGPGEFINVTQMGLISNDSYSFYLYDEGNSKILLYDKLFLYVKEYNLNYNIIGASDSFYISDSIDEIIFLAKMSNKFENGDCLFHHFSILMQRVVKCTGDSKVLINESDEMYELFLQARTGRFVKKEDSIYFSPRIYDGNIYRYQISELGLMFSKKIGGYRNISRILLENADPPQYRLSYKGNVFSGRIGSESVGLFVYSNQLVHFTKLVGENGELLFGAEIHKGDTGVLTYVTLLESIENDLSNIDVLHFSKNGILYYQHSNDRSSIFRADLSGLLATIL